MTHPHAPGCECDVCYYRALARLHDEACEGHGPEVVGCLLWMWVGLVSLLTIIALYHGGLL